VRPDGLTEVGSSHSSVEAYESTLSEGDDKFAKSFNKTCLVLGGRHRMVSESQDLRYLSRAHKRVHTLMHRVSSDALKAAHNKQRRNKATGVDGVNKDVYGQNLDGNIACLFRA